MSASLAEQIAMFLHQQGLAKWVADGDGGNLFIEVLPPSPDTCIMVRHTGGYAGAGIPLIQPTFQLYVRGDTDPRTARDLAYDALKALRYHEGQLVAGGDAVSIVWPMQDHPIYVGIDENGRHEYSVNLMLRVNEQVR